MPFRPNYRLDKTSRARSKAEKALEKQIKREQKSAQRKQERQDTERISIAEPDKEK